jgi:ubiquitin-like protein Pup
MNMAEREQKRRTTAPREDETVEEAAPAGTERADKIKAELDDLLDEIDEVLDENAEEFVRSYVQKGGQ